jgi:oligoendopeptidase F
MTIKTRIKLKSRRLGGAIILLAAVPVASPSQDRDRGKIADQYKWDLTALYSSDQAWRSQKDKLAAELPKLREFRGKLGSSAQQLAGALETRSRLERELKRLQLYAHLISDEDTRVSTYQGMTQEMLQLSSTFDAEGSYIEPETLKVDPGALKKFLAQEPRLEVYRHYLDDVSRRRTHTGSEAEEKLLASSKVISSGPNSVYNIFSNADFPYPSVVLSDGKTVKLDQAAYTLQRASPVREDRQKAMAAYLGALGAYRGTFGSLMNTNVQGFIFYARARSYQTSLQASLDDSNIPVSVYTKLLEGVNRNLPAFHRYLALRKRMLGLSELHYYDLYAPLVKSPLVKSPLVKLVDTKYSLDAAQTNILQALAPLGPEYAAGLKRAFSERWIDFFPSDGKAPGGYMDEAYDVHPYILVNYNAKYDDMSTVAHELGHSMQSYLSNKAQPYPLAAYPIFVAEVASTFNETLLLDHMLQTVTDDQTKLSLLGEQLENMRLTVFRQTQFAEFELRLHEMAEKGEPLTGDSISKLYMDIVKKYYGHDRGICNVDDYVAYEWAFIPHFYYGFYVYQYATSFAASSALSEKVLAHEPGATERYLKFLASGGSKYPIDLLKDAGIDMTTDEPLELTVKKMNRVMDEIDALLARTPASPPAPAH